MSNPIDEGSYMGKGNHKPGWMLRADPELARKFKEIEDRKKKMNSLMKKYAGKTSDEIAKMKKEEASPMIKPPSNRFDNKKDAFAHAKKNGGKVYRHEYVNPRSGMKSTTYSVKEEAERVDEASYDSLGLRSLYSTDPKKQPFYKTQKGREAAAKKNVPDLKSAIKSTLGKHPKPNLPEEVEQIDEGPRSDLRRKLTRIGNKMDKATGEQRKKGWPFSKGTAAQKLARVTRKTKMTDDEIQQHLSVRKEEAEQIDERGDYWHPDPKVDRQIGGRGAANLARQGTAPSKDEKKNNHLELLKKLAAAGSKIAANKKTKTEETEMQEGYKIAKHLAKKVMAGVKKEEVEQRPGVPFSGPYRDVSKPRKDQYGNIIKDKNAAKNLAKQGMAGVKKEEAELDEGYVIHKGKHAPGRQSSLEGTHHGVTVKPVYTDKKEAQAHADAINKGRGYKPEDHKNPLYGGVLYQVSPMKEEVEHMEEAAKWRSSSAAKPDPDHDWDRSSKSTGGMRATSDTRGDTGGEYNHSSLENRKKAQVVAKTGKTTKASNASLKNRIRANLAQKQNKPNLPEEVEQIDELSKDKMLDYINKASKDVRKSPSEKRMQGISQASRKVFNSEEVEQVQEVIGTTTGYSDSGPKVDAATRKAHQMRNVVTKGPRAGKVTKEVQNKLKDKIKNRMTKEEVSLTVEELIAEKKQKLTAKQNKHIDVVDDDKIDAKDFAKLRSMKK